MRATLFWLVQLLVTRAATAALVTPRAESFGATIPPAAAVPPAALPGDLDGDGFREDRDGDGYLDPRFLDVDDDDAPVPDAAPSSVRNETLAPTPAPSVGARDADTLEGSHAPSAAPSDDGAQQRPTTTAAGDPRGAIPVGVAVSAAGAWIIALIALCRRGGATPHRKDGAAAPREKVAAAREAPPEPVVVAAFVLHDDGDAAAQKDDGADEEHAPAACHVQLDEMTRATAVEAQPTAMVEPPSAVGVVLGLVQHWTCEHCGARSCAVCEAERGAP